MLLFVGLGNPGPRYAETPHNAGFVVCDRFAARHRFPAPSEKYRGVFTRGRVGTHDVGLLKPQTFMNLSGRSVAEALRFHKLSVEDTIVIHDDLDIPFGRVKLKEVGGHAGHNGLRSLAQELSSGAFVRVRVGIGRPLHGDVVNYVLNNFTPEEMSGLPRLLDGVIDLLELLISEGLPKTMSLYNNKELL